MPETTRLATTIDRWQPALVTALTHGVSNARTEGFNRITRRLRLPEHGQLPATYVS